MSRFPVRLYRPGIVEYESAWRWQREAAAALRAGRDGEILALLQHQPVYTLGRGARTEHVLADPSWFAERGAKVIEIDRGGDVTFHGPGQLIGYPILDLRRRNLGPVDYVRALETTLIATLAAFGVEAERAPGRPGVWAGSAKVAAIGVRVQGGITTHGFALNVDADLSWFDAIVPCGLAGVTVTSMARLLGGAPPMEAVERAVKSAFEPVFESRLAEAEASSVLAQQPIISHGF